MRVALVKQDLDIFGPWSSVRWVDTTPAELLKIWPNKCFQWGMTCLLQADWYVVPFQRETWYIQNAVLQHNGRAETVKRHVRNVVHPNDIPYNQYDVVISFDPILNPPPQSDTLFAYFMQEHWDPLYRKSLRRPEPGYDLFLDHMMNITQEVDSLPSSLAFPYPSDHSTIRKVLDLEKQDVAWLDWRTCTFLARTQEWTEMADKAAIRLSETLALPTKYKGTLYNSSWGFQESPSFGDARVYWEEVGSCRYYISVGRRSGGGVGLVEAAALGCICFGEKGRPYHEMVCHPHCLIDDYLELPKRVRQVSQSSRLQTDIQEFQDVALTNYFEATPLRLLGFAVALKKKLCL